MTVSPPRSARHSAAAAALAGRAAAASARSDRAARPPTATPADPGRSDESLLGLELRESYPDPEPPPSLLGLHVRESAPEPGASLAVATPSGPLPISELAAQLRTGAVIDADDVVAELDLDDRAAREQYGLPSAEALGGSVLTFMRHRRPRGTRRAPARHAYLGAALLRCALYLGPLSVAIAGIRSLRIVAWPVPALVLLLGWSAAQALTSLGASVLRRGGRPAAARLIGGGFAAVAGIWGAYVWVAPSAWLGPDRWLALTVGLGGIAVLATVTAALVTRTEAAVIRWSLPCWLLAAISIAETLGDGWAGHIPVGTLLPAAVTVAVIRAYRPVIGRRLPNRPPLDHRDLRRSFGYLIIGAAQAACVALLWRSGPPGATSPAALPLLLAVPVLEALVCWHIRQVDRGLNAAETQRDLRRHVRGVTMVTVAGLLPPLAAGAALAAGAYRLPVGVSGTDRAGVLALAAGTLLGGLFAGTFLLAARRRTGIAATLAAAAPLAIAALPLLPGPALDRLPAIVAVFAAAHLFGLVAVALTAADSGRSS
jgi:hypothetical protein